MAHDRERRMLLAGIGAASALAIARTARAATCTDIGPLAPTGPTMVTLYDRIAGDDRAKAECRRSIRSCPPSATAQFSITEEGVYYMVDNIEGQAGMACIEILVDNVEIEGDGFIITGVAGTLECIRTPNPVQCVGIYDLGIVDWHHTAINLSNSYYCYCEEVWFHRCNASGNPLGLGACALGPGGTIDDCNVLACVQGMLSVDRDGIVEECVVIDSTGGGISAVGPCTIEDNFILNNDGTGIGVGTGGGVVLNNRVCSCPIGMKWIPANAARSSVCSENDITDCVTGIEVASNDVTVEENYVGRCTKAIIISGSASRVIVEENHCPGSSSTAITLEAGTSRCLVISNAVACPPGVPGYDLGGANSWGPVVSAIGVGDITGSGSFTDPHTNFEH